MLAAQRSAGISGLVASSDVAVARSQLRKLAAMIDAGDRRRRREIVDPGPGGADAGAALHAR